MTAIDDLTAWALERWENASRQETYYRNSQSESARYWAGQADAYYAALQMLEAAKPQAEQESMIADQVRDIMGDELDKLRSDVGALRSENDALRERMDATELVLYTDVDAYKAAWAKTLKARRAAAAEKRDASSGGIRHWHAGRVALYGDLIRDLENSF